MIARTIVLTVVLVLSGSWAYAGDCNNGGMYEVNGYIVNDGTVTDCRTGLIWLQDANCKDNLGLPGIDKSNGWLEWHDAMVAYARNRFVPSLTNAAGAAKWTANGGAFNNVGTDFYWASTAVADHTSGHQPRFS